jgi:hypothetical protein
MSKSNVVDLAASRGAPESTIAALYYALRRGLKCLDDLANRGGTAFREGGS